ncbi:uncharacterized protein LOC142552635 [Primulina tabacum]|uniref:uncharacterized protein LOC142552635 n=1 Tax=Primulina tabacum TaxID=48773 RepID=UPI003F5A9761
MGVKRPFEEQFPELSLKQHKQFDQENKIILCEEDFPSAFASPNTDSFCEAKSGYYKLQHDRGFYSSHANAAPVDDKELDTSAPLSWVTSSSSEDDTGLEDATFGSYFQPYFDFSIPFQFPEQLENPYLSLFNCSPRKEIPVGPDRQDEVLPWGVNVTDSLQYFNSDNCTQQKPMGSIVPMPNDSTFESSLLNSLSKEVPVGPDHQAEVLPWDRNLPRKDCLGSDVREQRLMGTCVTPVPDDSAVNGVKVGQGRTDCCCPDVGSIRCVRQHVKEARETFREAIGEESFSELGFYDMGEEVACKWKAASVEHLFHEIIFSNPISCGRNFWKHLSAAFPTRTKNEIVSYYFNVFMLRRRATQNRSLLLEVDSDDDECKGTHGGYLYENRSHLMDSDTDDEYEDDDDHGAVDEQVGVFGEFCHVRGARDDSRIELFGNQDLRLSRGQSMSSDSENVRVDDGLIQCDGTSNGNDSGHVDK